MTKRRVELKGASIAYVGRLHKITWRSASHQIEAGGGTAHGQLRASLTCFVEGSGAGSKATKARARGVLAITEAQLLTLLSKGVVEWEEADAFADKATFDESVAELRGIFNAAPDAQGWTRCLEIVESCEAERLEDLLSYLEPFIAAWDRAPMGKWSCAKEHALMQHAPPNHWTEALPEDELRVAPPRWIYELAQGQHHPKHSIVRAINLELFKLNGTLGKNIVQSPYIRELRQLNLGGFNAYSQGFYETLLGAELMRTVRVLRVSSGITQGKHMAQAWGAQAHSFDVLEELRSEAELYVYSQETRAYKRFKEMSLPCLAGVKLARLDGSAW